jgi:hypothetical protein
LHKCIEFQPPRSLVARNFPYEPDSLIHARHLPTRKVRRPDPAISECYPGETHNVGFPSSKPKELRAIAADEDRRMGFLNRERRNGVAANAIILARKGHPIAPEQPLDDDYCF